MYKTALTLHSRIALKLFCVSLYTECLSDLYKKFQVLSIYDAYVECEI